MTKADEIAILRDAAAKLGNDSYAGPWLAAVIPHVESDIQNDFPVMYDYRKVQHECAGMLTEAAAKVERMLADAQARYDAIVAPAKAAHAAQVKATETKLHDMVRSARFEIQQALSAINEI